MMKVGMPVEAANAAVREGTLSSTLKSILDEIKPESAYFGEENGCRTGYIVVNIADMSDIPRIAEPFFLAFNASIELKPVMVAEDLMKAAPHLEAAAKKYGHTKHLMPLHHS
jgi:hypothetical protein